MIKMLNETKPESRMGIFHNPDVFDVNQSDVDEFDKRFEYREKLVLDTQLKEL